MRRLVLAAVTLIATAPVLEAQPVASPPWVEKAFKGSTTHDFGSVARGAQLYHQFQMTNIWAVPLEITSVRTSCGCITATASQQVIQPRESATVDIKMDAHRFTGPKTVSIYITVGPQFTSTAVLRVSANSRADVVLNPGQLNFGVVPQGQSTAQMIDVEYAGVLDWRVSDVVTNGVPVDVTYEELYRRPGQVGYRIRATLKPDAAPGHLKQELTLKTNDPTSPTVPVLVEATIQASLTVVPGTISLGVLKMGDKVSRRVVVRANQPFKIVAVDGVGDGIEAELPPSSAAVQIVTLKYQPGQTGDLHRQLRIKTDLDKEASTTVLLEGKIEP
jgi:Protein of unknown function (DUF1573)